MPRHKSVHPFTRDGDNKPAVGRVAFAGPCQTTPTDLGSDASRDISAL
jgi:hypothetical protein